MNVVIVIVSVLVLTLPVMLVKPVPFGPLLLTPPPPPPPPPPVVDGGLGEIAVGFGTPVQARADPAQVPRRIATSACIVCCLNHHKAQVSDLAHPIIV